MMAEGIESMLVNPFAQRPDSSSQKSQSIERAESLEDPLVIKAFGIYNPSKYKYRGLPALSPAQIDAVLQKIICSYERDDFSDYWGGKFFNSLLETSIQMLGYNRYILSVGDSRICGLPKISGNKERLTIELLGDIGYMAGFVHNCDLTVHGSGEESIGGSSTNSRIEIFGDGGHNFGTHSRNCTFIVHGAVDYNFANHAKDCTFTVYGDIPYFPFKNSERCTVQTVHKSVFKRLAKHNYEYIGNRIQLIGTEGAVIKEVLT